HVELGAGDLHHEAGPEIGAQLRLAEPHLAGIDDDINARAVALAQPPHEVETGRPQAGLRAVENVDEAVRAGANGIGGEPLDLGVDLGDGPRLTVAVAD